MFAQEILTFVDHFIPSDFPEYSKSPLIVFYTKKVYEALEKIYSTFGTFPIEYKEIGFFTQELEQKYPDRNTFNSLIYFRMFIIFQEFIKPPEAWVTDSRNSYVDLKGFWEMYKVFVQMKTHERHEKCVTKCNFLSQ